MTIHFEDLWVDCEKLHQDAKLDSSLDLVEELTMKTHLYRMIAGKTEIAENELQKMKERAMGEILLTLTKLSNKENINVYEALSVAAQYHSITHYSGKYSD